MGIVGWLLVVTAVAGIGGTGLGGVISALFRRDSSRAVSLLLSFAGGVMLAVVCFDMVETALHPEPGVDMNVFLVILNIAVGYVVVYMLNLAIDRATDPEVHHKENHPKTADDLDELIHSDHLEVHRESHTSLFSAGVVMACAIALHNLPEGMVIGAGFAADMNGQYLAGSGMVMAVVIGLHNIPEGMAVAVPLIAGGMKRGRAILVTAASGAPTVLGALVGYYLGALGPVGLCLSLGFASGAMLYVVFGELLPESILMWQSKMPAAAAVVGMLVGLAIISV